MIILALLLILQIFLVACGSSDSNVNYKDKDKIDGGASESAADSYSGETETADARYTSDVPDMDFNGEKFRVLGVNPEVYVNYGIDFDFEAETGDVLDDAIYRRNRNIEEKYNIKFESTYLQTPGDSLTELRKFVLAGSDDYEMAMLITRDAFSAALDEYLSPIGNIPYIDLSKPWYRSAVNDGFSMGGKKFLAYSDECLSMYMFTTSILFNKAYIADYALEDPYALVRNRTWTWDKFYEMAVAAIKDLNGDGKYDKDDIWGIIGEEDTFFPPVWMGSNLLLVEKNDGDMPVLTAPQNEGLLEIFEKIIDWQKTDGFFLNSFLVFGYDEASRAKGSELFSSGHSLFKIGRITDILVLRGMDTDFGILPLPKYNATQENYVSRMEDAWLHVVPASNTKLEMTGVIMEVLAAKSKNNVIPAFFDIALKSKYSRDEESAETLDILFNSVTVDIGDIIWYSTVRGPICEQILAKKSGFASTLERMTNQVDKLIEKIDEAVN